MINFGRSLSAGRLAYGFVALAFVWGGFLGIRHISGAESFVDGVENLTIDWRYRLAGPRPAPHNVVIAAIDDEAVREAGAYPLPRETLARIVRVLGAFHPRAIAIDIAFLNGGPPAADQELAEALRSTKSTIAAIGLFERGGVKSDRSISNDLVRVPHPSSVLWPATIFREAAEVGIVNLTTDMGIPRFLPMLYRTDDGSAPSFALTVAATALGADPTHAKGSLKLAKKAVDVDVGYHLPVRFYGPRGSFRQFSVAKILHGNLTEEEVSGRVVLLGVTATEGGDFFATPFDRVVPGVEIQATGIANLLADDGLVRSTFVRWIDAGAAVALPCIAVIPMARRRAFAGLSIAVLAFAVWVAVCFVTFLYGYWLSIVVPLAALLPVATICGVAQQAVERYAADRLSSDNAALIKFQSPALLEHIKLSEFLEKPVHQDVAAVFLDLSGFTSASETLGAMWARDFLAGFQSIVGRDVAAHDGFVASFMGDGAMIIFGLPEPRSDDASRALLAAKGLRGSVENWLANLPSAARAPLSVRIGGHFGPAVVSRLGSARQQHIAATGDTVNVASRLLEVSKQRQCCLIVSEELFAAAGLLVSSEEAPPEDLVIDIRGRAKPLRIRMWR